MTKSDEFREYAKEAIGWSYNSKTEDEKQALIRLARTWARAAMYRDQTFIGPQEPRLAA
jgi:hypothetical protein